MVTESYESWSLNTTAMVVYKPEVELTLSLRMSTLKINIVFKF